MKFLLAITLVICGSSLITGRSLWSLYDDDDDGVGVGDSAELFGGYGRGGVYDDDDDIDDAFDMVLKGLFGDDELSEELKSPRLDDDDDDYLRPVASSTDSPAEVYGSYLKTLYDYYKNKEQEVDLEDDDYTPTPDELFGQNDEDSTEYVDKEEQEKEEKDNAFKANPQKSSSDELFVANGDDSTEYVAKDEEEKDNEFKSSSEKSSSDELFLLSGEDSTEDNEKENTAASDSSENNRFVFSAHIGFSPESLVQVNLLHTDSDGEVKQQNYNFYDILTQPFPSQEEVQPVEESQSREVVNTNDETLELLKPSSTSLQSLLAPHHQQADLLQKLSLSSANSELLSNEYSDNIMDFVTVQKNLRESLGELEAQNDQLNVEFFQEVADHFDYNGQQHKQIEEQVAGMLSKVDEIRGKLVQMQNIEQKLNYHLLLNALLKEIYGDRKYL